MTYQEHRNLQFDFFERVCNGLRRVDAKEAREFGRFPYIPASLDTFRSTLNVVSRLLEWTKGKKEPTFLDAGCGIGDKVWIAQTLGYDAKGIELCNDSIRIGRLALGRNAIIKANLLTYKGYDKFEVIYLYRPMSDEKLEVEFEERLIKHSRNDVIIISAGCDTLRGQNLARVDHQRSFNGKLNLPDTGRAYLFDIYIKTISMSS
jgi:SAM-dependent methyltransferase